LEVSEEMCLQEILHAYYSKSIDDDLKGNYIPNIKEFENLDIRDDLWDLEKITQHIEYTKPDICFIDFAQNIQVKGSK
jgi:hypothetical protein